MLQIDFCIIKCTLLPFVFCLSARLKSKSAAVWIHMALFSSFCWVYGWSQFPRNLSLAKIFFIQVNIQFKKNQTDFSNIFTFHWVAGFSWWMLCEEKWLCDGKMPERLVICWTHIWNGLLLAADPSGVLGTHWCTSGTAPSPEHAPYLVHIVNSGNSAS